MQVPEKLSLIGGSILLASTLAFTLKSQASNILPKVNNGMSTLMKSDQERQRDQQKQAEQAFNSNFQNAQQKSWRTGQWGTAKFYVDNQGNMHVGAGQLSVSADNLFSSNWLQNNIKTINLDEDVQAPQNSNDLFGAEHGSNNYSTVAINGLDRLDTSNVTNMSYMFGYDSSLTNLDLSHFDTHNVTNMSNMFLYDNIHQLSLGSDNKLQNSSNTNLSGTYQSNGQTLSIDGNAHPGTWIRQ